MWKNVPAKKQDAFVAEINMKHIWIFGRFSYNYEELQKFTQELITITICDSCCVTLFDHTYILQILLVKRHQKTEPLSYFRNKCALKRHYHKQQ